MADLLLATPALAQKVWRSMASPSTRRVARKLSQSGLPISHETVNRWRRDGWRVVERPQHPLDAARASLDDAVPVLTGDPTTTIEDLLRNSPDREQLEELSDAELLRKAAREVLIAVCLAARALMLKPTLVLTKPAEVGVLMRALAECYRAATVGSDRRGTCQGSLAPQTASGCVSKGGADSTTRRGCLPSWPVPDWQAVDQPCTRCF